MQKDFIGMINLRFFDFSLFVIMLQLGQRISVNERFQIPKIRHYTQNGLASIRHYT